MKIIEVIYEDKDLLVINKPSGLIVNRSQSTKDITTLQDWTETKFKVQSSKFKDSSDFVQRSGIVHRLDKETSGALLIAKNEASFINLQSQFKKRTVKKTYLALVHGKLPSREGEIRAPIVRSPYNREKFGVFIGGRDAITAYKVKEYYKQELKEFTSLYTLVEAMPRTGRTHQIRVHFKYLGYPIVADSKYSGRKRTRQALSWCPRLFLHAQRLQFLKPSSGKTITCDAKLPEDLKKSLEKLIRV